MLYLLYFGCSIKYIYRFYSRNIYDKYRLIVMVLYIYYSIYDVYMGLCLDRSRYLYRTIDLISNIQYIYT